MEENKLNDDLELLFSDYRLTELCERLKTADDILDVIRLSENQHSDIMAWMLDPREGHGQGDQILRDFLLAATQAAAQECLLDRRGMTARFFSNWPPSKIITSNFNGAFIARELGIKAAERVDLFIIDPANKFVILIENKAGTTHSSQQLDSYRENWVEAVRKHSHLKEYNSVFIALDRNFSGDDRADHPSNGHWLHLGYDWLKSSADRAVLHLERGNAAARLVVSYCNRQTDWESPASKRAITLAAELHETHASAIRELLGETTGRIEKAWIENKSSNTMMFMLQNKAAVSLLREMRGMASIKEHALSKINSLERGNIHCTRARLYICPPKWEKYVVNGYWPVYFSVTYSDDTGSKYDLTLHFSKHTGMHDDIINEIQNKLTKFNPQFSSRKTTINRNINIDSGVTSSELIQKLGGYSKELRDLIP